MSLVPYTEKIFVFSGSKVGKISTAAKENLMFAWVGVGGWGSSQMNKKQKTRLVPATVKNN